MATGSGGVPLRGQSWGNCSLGYVRLALSLFTGSSVSHVIENWPVVEFDSLAPNRNGSAYLIDFLGLSEEAETDVRFCVNF